MIKQNRHRYSVSSLCRLLGIARNTFYYYQRKINKSKNNDVITASILHIFKNSYRSYGTRRIQKMLHKQDIYISRKRISVVMKMLNLVSKYTKKSYKKQGGKVNDSSVANLLNREFTPGTSKKVVVSDLSYVRVKNNWHYLCVLVNIQTREIIGSSAGKRKNAALVMQAMSKIAGKLSDITMFHSDRGNEFDNALIDQCLTVFNIDRSLSNKGCPYDNAVAEATFKSVKTEFVGKECFGSLDELQQRFSQYVYWFNHARLHTSLDYLTPSEYKAQMM